MKKMNLQRYLSLLLTLMMLLSCLSLPAMAAGDAAVSVTSNTLKGTANTENFSTLKEYIDSDMTVPGNPVTYTGSATISAGNGKLDASGAKITVAPGDGYYVNDLVFNGSAAENIKANPDGTLSFTMNTGDLTWNNFGYNVPEGGVEWSAQGGDLNGQYHIRLNVSGLTCDGKAVDDVTVMVYVYIYGREFSDMASPQNPGSSKWGTGNLGQAVLPYAAKAEKPEDAVTLSESDGLVWAWGIAHEGEDEGYSPANTDGEIMLCDKAADNLYITWPAGVDASKVTADDVTITLASEYGETKTLKAGGDRHVAIDRWYNGEQLEIPGGDYAVYTAAGETQISINFVHWLTYPVYSKMTVAVKAGGKDYSETFDIDSVYLYTVQTGGGLDLDKTVTVQNFYGIANIDKFTTSDFFTESYSYYASNQPIQRPDAEPGSVYGDYTGTIQNKGGFDVEWTLALNEDGTYHLHQYFAMMGSESDWYGNSWELSDDGYVSCGPIDTAKSSATSGSGWGGKGESCWLVDTYSKTMLERDEDFAHYSGDVTPADSSQGGQQGGQPGGPDGGAQQGGGQQGGNQQGDGQQQGGQQGGTGGNQQQGGQQGGNQQGGTGGGTMGGAPGMSGNLFLGLGADGKYYVTEDKDDPNCKLDYPDYVSAPELIGNAYFYYSGTGSMQALKDDVIEMEYNGAAYTFNRKLVNSTSKVDNCLSTARLEKIGAELLPGYAGSAKGFGSDNMNVGWAVFLRDSGNDVGWTVEDFGLPFTDVTMYSTHTYQMVAWAYREGITTGTDGAAFSLDEPLTRAQAFTFLWRFAGKPETSASIRFADVAAGSYYEKAAQWAAANGYTTGTTTFGPEQKMSFAEVATLLWRLAGNSDASYDTIAAWCLENGIINVKSDRVASNSACTREQFISYLYRYMTNVEK